MWQNTIKLGVKNLLLHKLRSALTILGVVLGVGSVIAMLAIGEGSKQEALEQIRKLGSSNVILRSVNPAKKVEATDDTALQGRPNVTRVVEYGLKYDDLDQLAATLPMIERAVPTRLVRNDARHVHRSISSARILGTTPDFLPVKGLKVRSGRFLTATDLEAKSNVAVLGAGAADRLFSFEDPLGQSLVLESGAYRVVGVLEPAAGAKSGPSAAATEDPDSVIYIPLSTSQVRFSELQRIQSSGSLDLERTELNEIILTAKDDHQVVQTAAMANDVLLRRHPKGDDFAVLVPLELLKRAEEEKRLWKVVLGSIAGISLVVGGVGIMNIMLASVIERTPEIGIRRALGARRRDITKQFLIESMVLSSVGGVLGILLGVSLAVAVNQFSGIQTVVGGFSILIALGTSASVGVLFGIYPARRAARMSPIEALRHK